MTNWADTPEGTISRLDDALLRRGEDAVLRRQTLGPGGVQIPFDVTVRIQLRGYDPSELVGLITQQDQKFILSPTQIDLAQWPGASVPQAPPPHDKRVPKLNDILVTTRGNLAVQAAAGIYRGETLVRIEGRARGQ